MPVSLEKNRVWGGYQCAEQIKCYWTEGAYLLILL